MKYEAIVMGVSAGGFNALQAILPKLPADFRIPIIIVMHIGSTTDGFWIEMIGNNCGLKVKEADEKERLTPGNVYLAPPGYHLLIESDSSLSLSTDKPVNFARPSVDVLFESAADVFGGKLIGIVLTGSNNDGANGLKKIKKNGGLAIVQEPSTAVASQMPDEAIKITSVDYILPLHQIAGKLIELEKTSK